MEYKEETSTNINNESEKKDINNSPKDEKFNKIKTMLQEDHNTPEKQAELKDTVIDWYMEMVRKDPYLGKHNVEIKDRLEKNLNYIGYIDELKPHGQVPQEILNSKAIAGIYLGSSLGLNRTWLENEKEATMRNITIHELTHIACTKNINDMPQIRVITDENNSMNIFKNESLNGHDTTSEGFALDEAGTSYIADNLSGESFKLVYEKWKFGYLADRYGKDLMYDAMINGPAKLELAMQKNGESFTVIREYLDRDFFDSLRMNNIDRFSAYMERKKEERENPKTSSWAKIFKPKEKQLALPETQQDISTKIDEKPKRNEFLEGLKVNITESTAKDDTRKEDRENSKEEISDDMER